MPERRRRTAVEGLLFAFTVALLLWLGLWARQRVWAGTETFRFAADMQNGWHWGSRAANEGFFSLYDRVVADSSRQKYELDYLPLRLAAMTLWADLELSAVPAPTQWQRDYAFNRPLLRFNSFCEAMTAVGIAGLVAHFVRRDRRPTLLSVQRPLYGIWIALLAGACAWFNPASLVSAHGRPTWDVWVTPFYVWAVWCAVRDRWLIAGCVLGVGSMFKGQELFVAPIFLLWPLMRFRVGAAGRFVVGFSSGIAVLVSPWMAGRSMAAIVFVVAVACVPVGFWVASRRWPVRGWRMPARWLQWAVPAATAMAIAACAPLFGGSINWLRVGLIYGATKFDGLETGGSESLAGILQASYGWQANDLVPPLQRLLPGLTISHLLISLYGLCLLPIAWALSQYDRRGDRRFLLAMAAPWLVYFALFPKVHERYLLWGATIACAGVAVSYGTLWLALFFSICSTCMSLHQMAQSLILAAFLHLGVPESAREVYGYLHPMYPGMAWAVLMATATWGWTMLAGTFAGRRSPPHGVDAGFCVEAGLE